MGLKRCEKSQRRTYHTFDKAAVSLLSVLKMHNFWQSFPRWGT